MHWIALENNYYRIDVLIKRKVEACIKPRLRVKDIVYSLRVTLGKIAEIQASEIVQDAIFFVNKLTILDNEYI